ncbi:MAG TPA: M4 family metallopeptidase [Vicinamibacterales bacterium]
MPTRVVVCLLAVCVLCAHPASAQSTRGLISINARSSNELRSWDSRIDTMLRDGDLRVRTTRADTLLSGRTHVRADQYFKGVRVIGGDIARQVEQGVTLSVFGTVYEGIDVNPTPDITDDEAKALVEASAGVTLGPSRRPELVVLPLDEGRFVLAWRVRAASRGDVRLYYVNAHTGDLALEYSDRKGQDKVGTALGVLGDTKKISVQSSGGRYYTNDQLRPPAIKTHDMQGNVQRMEDFLNGLVPMTLNDVGSDSDNAWTDGALDDAHVYAGRTYDYYFHRFGRAGLDNHDIPMWSFVHPVKRTDFSLAYYNQYSDYFVNAFYAGDGVMVYGEGLPAGVTLGGQVYDYFAGALDVVAHELTHGVTDYSSNLIYRNESGALNEAFSDMMGTAAEFYFQQPGNGSMRADYLVGEDIVRPGGFRSMENPGAYGDPDHYANRYLGTQDNGGVHSNSGIANNAYYLAIEGGTNRTSGLSVQGVGQANREQIEKVFYRAFTQFLTSNSNFAAARTATIQAARDLYGAGSAAERAVTQAWTAVGVN